MGAMVPIIVSAPRKLTVSPLLPIESYIAPCDFTLGGQHVRKGPRVMAAHINNEVACRKIKRGEYSGFSVCGRGETRANRLP